MTGFAKCTVANERRDYVERLVEELARVVADLLARLRAGPPAAAEVTREARAATLLDAALEFD